jgi:hypothetical protein
MKFMNFAGILGELPLWRRNGLLRRPTEKGAARDVLLWAALLSITGCWSSGPPRVLPDLPDPSATSKAMEMYDTNHDGFLDPNELEKVPGLKAALKRLDNDHDGKLSKQEIADRINFWADSRAGRVAVRLRVTHKGQPLSGARVTLVPENFLGAALPSGSGTTSEMGTASISAPSAANSQVRGLSPGFYRVEITKDGEKIPAKYNNETTLGAEASSDDQQVGLVFDLKY